MNPCSPGNSLTQKQAKMITDFKLPKKFLDNLSEENICSIYKKCEGNDLPVPPLNLFITRTHLYYIDPKSPLKPEDYEVLFGKSKKKDIQKISKKMNLVVDPNESMGEIKGAIMAFFKKKNILEPVKIKLKYDKDIPRELNRVVGNTENSGNSENMGNSGNSENMGNIKPTINSENMGTTLTPVNTENKKNGPTPPPVNLKVNKKNENTPTPPAVNLKVPNRPKTTTTSTTTTVVPAVTTTTSGTNVGNAPKKTNGQTKTSGNSKFGFSLKGNEKPKNIKKNRNQKNLETTPTNRQYRDFIRLLKDKYGYETNFSKYKKMNIPGLLGGSPIFMRGYTNEGIYEMESAVRQLLGRNYRIDTKADMDIVLRKLEGEDIGISNFEDILFGTPYEFKPDEYANKWYAITAKYQDITGAYLYSGDEIKTDKLKRKEMYQKLLRSLTEKKIKKREPTVTFGPPRTREIPGAKTGQPDTGQQGSIEQSEKPAKTANSVGGGDDPNASQTRESTPSSISTSVVASSTGGNSGKQSRTNEPKIPTRTGETNGPKIPTGTGETNGPKKPKGPNGTSGTKKPTGQSGEQTGKGGGQTANQQAEQLRELLKMFG